MDKAEWRRWARSQPGADPAESESVCRHLSSWLRDRGLEVVLTYLALPGEIDLGALHGQGGFRFLVTRTPANGRLTVHELAGPLERAPLGYLQPRVGTPQVPVEEVEATLVPGLAFDREGRRLGRGKGYYDRLLASLPPTCCRVGITVDRLVVDRLPSTGHDVGMHSLATPTGVSEVAPCG